MGRKVIHLFVEKQGIFGMVNTTLCGKTQWQGGEAIDGGGNNVTLNPKEVTCKLCLKDKMFPKEKPSSSSEEVQE